jgi:hypothetical protein
VSPAHVSRERRWRVLLAVLVVVVGVGVAAGTRSTPAPAGAPLTPSGLVDAPDAESSAWYCTGQSTGSGISPGFLVLTNTTARPVTADINAVSDTGASVHAAVAVPASAVLAPPIPALSSGTWESETVTVAGGGLAVSQTAHGSSGWSEAPCQSTTAASWYFAGGTTANSDPLYLSLLNPTSTPVVVDLSFMTPTGAVHPINYQGIVLQPGQVQVEDVASEVQNESIVSTVVSTRTGRVVATEVQGFAGTSAGLSLVTGAPIVEPHWTIPQGQEVAGGSGEIDVFNPGNTTEAVTVRARLGSGPLAPLAAKVAPGSTWVLTTSTQTRIPVRSTYSADIRATGGPGVVVGRTVTLPSSASAPQAGMALAVGELSTLSPTGRWVVPPPGTTSSPAVSGAAPESLALANTSGAPERFIAYAVTPSGDRTLAAGTLEAGATGVVSGAPLAAAGLNLIMVRSSGPMAVSEDAGPTGGIGVVTMPGLPLAAVIGL